MKETNKKINKVQPADNKWMEEKKYAELGTQDKNERSVWTINGFRTKYKLRYSVLIHVVKRNGIITSACITLTKRQKLLREKKILICVAPSRVSAYVCLGIAGTIKECDNLPARADRFRRKQATSDHEEHHTQ